MFGKRGAAPAFNDPGPAPEAAPAPAPQQAPAPPPQDPAQNPQVAFDQVEQAFNQQPGEPVPVQQTQQPSAYGSSAPQLQQPQQPAAPQPPADVMQPEAAIDHGRSEEYYDVKTTVFNALIDTIDLTQLSRLDTEAAREEIRDIVSEIVAIKNVVMSISEQEELLEDICNDVLGYGPLEPLLARDDIADIMVNGAEQTFIEVEGKVEPARIRFADNAQLMNICQRIVSQVGRRVDEASPICDARLIDGSRVNVIAPPLAIDGPSLTIRKFKRDRLTLEQLVKYGSITPEGAAVLGIIGKVRCNTVISGGTGSGKTTLLNCLTAHIEKDERIITCEDSAELQLQQPHVVRLETRPPNLEGEGEVTMRDLVKNCLRMRPDRIIVGEVRGTEAFDLLQAMNTGHDGSMGTLHANSPRECLSRLESMILMGGYNLPSRTIREMIVASIDVIIQASRLRDGSRKITHITEVLGMEGDIITLQDIFLYDISGEDANGKLIGQHRSTGIARPRFWDRATYYGAENELAQALAAAEVDGPPGQPLGDTLG
jgi:pilus assembly protein CpaF